VWIVSSVPASPVVAPAPRTDAARAAARRVDAAEREARALAVVARSDSRLPPTAAIDEPAPRELPRRRRRRPAGASAPAAAQRATIGWLDVNSMPPSSVYIDGKHRGETPLQGLELAGGTHELRLVTTTRLSRTMSIQIQAGERLKRFVLIH
jgi:ferric-dicitrate binding protein FerR (iron transport regulator)